MRHARAVTAMTLMSSALATGATFRFASIHGDGMVLQASGSTVWGFGGGAVTVSIDGSAGVAAARSSWLGQDTWLAKLPPQKASFGEHTITAASGAASASLTGVLFGDVLFCAGQSNMDYPINGLDLPGKPGKVDCWDPANENCTMYNDTTPKECAARKNVGCLQCHYGCVQNAQEEVVGMAQYDRSMRLNIIANSGAHFPAASRPVAEQKNTGWLPPSRMGGAFSAACWFWGRDTSAALAKQGMARPIGLVQAAVGGTSLQFWSSDDAIAQCQGLGEQWEWPANFRNGTGNLSTGYKLPDVPTGWNAKVVPLLRTVIRAASWYQGESNTGLATPGGDARQYNCSMQALVRDWRRNWSEGTGGASDAEFAFGWFQLNSCYRAGEEESRTTPPQLIPTNWSYQNPKLTSGHGEFGEWTPCGCAAVTPKPPRGTPCRGQGAGFPSVRWAFTQSLALRKTFQAVILDTPSAYGSVHSPYKQPAGSRLARAGLATIYNLSRFGAVEPRLASVQVQATWRLAIAIKLRGLGATGIEAPRAAAGFELLCSDMIWHSALLDAKSVTNDTISLPVPQGCVSPSAVRYLWYATPCGNTPFSCPIYTAAEPLGGLSGEREYLPLGPFVAPIPVKRNFVIGT